MSDHVVFTHLVCTYSVYGYLDWVISCRSDYEANWIARRWLRSKTRRDGEEIEARRRKEFKKGIASQRRVAIDPFHGTKYTKGKPPLRRSKELLCKLVCYRDTGELEIVLYLANVIVAMEVGRAWLNECPGNSYRLPGIASGSNRKVFKRMPPPWNGEVVNGQGQEDS